MSDIALTSLAEARQQLLSLLMQQLKRLPMCDYEFLAPRRLIIQTLSDALRLLHDIDSHEGPDEPGPTRTNTQ